MVPIIVLAESLSTINLHFTTRVFSHIAISPFLGGKKLTEKDKVFADDVPLGIQKNGHICCI